MECDYTLLLRLSNHWDLPYHYRSSQIIGIHFESSWVFCFVLFFLVNGNLTQVCHSQYQQSMKQVSLHLTSCKCCQRHFPLPVSHPTAVQLHVWQGHANQS